MRKLLLAAVLGLCVAGCAQQIAEIKQAYTAVTSAKVDYRYAQLAVVAFNSLEKDGAIYLNLPTCKTNGPVLCHDRAATVQIYAAFKAGRVARDNLVGYMRANPCVPDSSGAVTCPLIPQTQSVYSALQSAISTLKAIYDQYHVTVTSPQGA